MLFEWLRGSLFTGFPWLALGYCKRLSATLLGFAPITGVYGISLLLVFSAALLFIWFEKVLERRYGLPFMLIWLSGFCFAIH